MRLKRFPFTFVALFLTAVVALAQQPLAPSPERLQRHVSYLASDALDGRRTGTAGANDAARYIAGEFARLGLQPPGRASSRRPSRLIASYLQPFPYVGKVELGKANTLTVSGDQTHHLQVGVDWIPLAYSSSQKIENAEILFAGYGITASEVNYNDYKGKYTKNQVAVVFAGSPDGDNPHSAFARSVELRFKVTAARNAGVGALLIIAKDNNLKDSSFARLRYDHGGDAGIPVAVISREAASRILGRTDTPIEAYENAADSRQFATAAPAENGDGAGVGRKITKEEFLWLPKKEQKLTLSIAVRRNEVPAYNVVGILEGSDPVLKKENIIIGAHYDHLGRGGEGSGSLAPRSGEIHHGADDNASGTAGLIELARVFSAQRPRLKRTVVFIAFGGEEEGLLGSNFYVNNPTSPLSNTVAMINMDMIGRMKDGKLTVGGVGTAKEWRQILGQNSDFALTLNEDGFGPSDHSSFYGKQVPVLFFFTGTHPDYHKPSDTFEKINYKDEARILSLVARIVRDVDGANDRLTYTTAKSDQAPRTGGFRVYLGTIPNYGEGSDGLLIDGVRDDSPAAKAGIKSGDRIVKIGDREIKNVYDYTYALGEMKAGQEYGFEIIRGSEKLTVKVTPEARK
jgi:Zn-dependent M28 family amino/carboxypeptidase